MRAGAPHSDWSSRAETQQVTPTHLPPSAPPGRLSLRITPQGRGKPPSLPPLSYLLIYRWQKFAPCMNVAKCNINSTPTQHLHRPRPGDRWGPVSSAEYIGKSGRYGFSVANLQRISTSGGCKPGRQTSGAYHNQMDIKSVAACRAWQG